MTTLTPRLQIPIPGPGDPFKPVSVDLPAIGARLDAVAARQPGAALSAATVRDVGQVGQVRAGRVLTAADFTVGLSLSAPLGLWNLSDLSDSSGAGRTLSNKGAVPFGLGILGAASSAAVFAGSTAQVLYVADTGGADALRINTGSWGCWLRTAKRDLYQVALSRAVSAAAAGMHFALDVTAGNVARALSSDGAASSVALGTTDVCDGRWHFVVVTHDGISLRLYVDGALEGQALAGPMQSVAAPLNIGGYAADGATAVPSPGSWYGRIDEAFVTGDVLDVDQARFLYAAKIAHGYPVTPVRAHLAIVRKRRGAALATTDFPSTPLRLHNFTAASLSDIGSGGVALTSNPSGGAITSVAGADGQRASAFMFTGAHLGLSASDAGLPNALVARSYGCWFRTALTTSDEAVMGWGTLNTADARIAVLGNTNGGKLVAFSAADAAVGPSVIDGQWHFVVVVEDNAAADGVKRKLYLDGKMVAGSTVLNAITLAGADRFRVGASPTGIAGFVGPIDGAFVCNVALTSDQVMVLYQKAQQTMLLSPKAEGDHVEGFDATSVYVINDTLEPQYAVSLEVAA